MAQQFIWMELLLERTETVPLIEKEKIKERLSMFEQLWEESPMIQRMREQYRVKGIQEGFQEGRQKGRLEGLQDFLVNVVHAEYPDLAGLARQQASKFDKPEMLELLIQKVMVAPDAAGVCLLLVADKG